MNKFTAGPWTTDPSQSFYVKAPDGTVICNANTQANQELIREAPEMAAALEAAKVALTEALGLLEDVVKQAVHNPPFAEVVTRCSARCTEVRDEAAAVLVNAVGEG